MPSNTNLRRLRVPCRALRPARGTSEISQFAPVLIILFVLILIPLINLVALVVAGSIQYLATNDIATKAATQPDYAGALSAMTSEAMQFQNSGLAKFAHLAPNQGYSGCGNDMFVIATQLANGKVDSSPANQPLSQPVNTATEMYEISVKSGYTVQPFINLQSAPFVSEIPGLGKPVSLSFLAHRPFENPGGLQANPNSLVSGGGSVPHFNRASSSDAIANASLNTWRNPKIYQEIQDAGETIVSENVFVVQASNPDWTPAGVTVTNGEKIWIDTQAIGVWNAYPAHDANLDANGMEGWSPQAPNATVPSLGQSALIGRVGTAGQPFFLGDDQYNYPPPGTGNLAMIFNDSYYPDNTGAQLVRVVIVQ